jgi:replicative DNA helicase
MHEQQTASTTKGPPHSEEAERAILGALLLDPDRIADVSEILSQEDFYNRRHRVLYELMRSLGERDIPIDFVSMGEALTTGGQMQLVGGDAFLIELAHGVTSAAHLMHHVRMVADLSTLRRLVTEATEIIRKVSETPADGDSVRKLLDESEHRIFGVSHDTGRGGADPFAKVLDETFKRIDAQSHRKGLTGLDTGYYDLNDKLCGLNAGDLIVIAARPSMGKTALALNIVEHVALSQPAWLDRRPVVLLFSLEMGKQQLVSRVLCSRAEVDAHKLRTGRIPDEDYATLVQAADDLSGARIFIDDTPGLSVMALRGRARRLRAQEGLDLVVVDYLQLMSHPKAESRQMEISAISRSLKALARELEIPVLALAQLSRAVELRDPPRPQLADLRESGSIEQDADVVGLLYRPEYYEKYRTEENEGLAELIIAKHRNGPTGKVDLTFFPSFMRFKNRQFSSEHVFA